METVETEAAIEAAVTATGKCTKQLARIAGKSAKCLLSLLREDLYTAGIASKNTGSLAEGTKIPVKGAWAERPFFLFFSLFIFSGYGIIFCLSAAALVSSSPKEGFSASIPAKLFS